MLVILGIILLVGSFFVSLLLTTLIKTLALRIGFLARPVSGRFSKRTIPLGGGIAIFSTLMIFILAGTVFMKLLLIPGHFDWVAETVKINPADFLDMLLMANSEILPQHSRK